VAGGVILVVIILLALLIHGCQSSNTSNSLKDYNNSVSNLIDHSDSTVTQVFSDLSSGSGASTVQQEVNQLHADTGTQLQDAEALTAPSQMSLAQQNLLLALSMRRDGLAEIDKNVDAALNTTGGQAKAAVGNIAAAMSNLFASDVVYKNYTVAEIASALHSDGVSVGGTSGVTINGGQVVSDLGWLQTNFISTKIGAKVPSSQSSNGTCPSLCGHSLNSVSVGSTTLTPTGTNDVQASPAPTFTLNITNGGEVNEFNVGCKVTVVGANDSGSSTISETTAGQTTTCSVKLKSAPTPGIYQVNAEVLPVTGEKNTANNSASYSVDFQ
jgi:hypothetical protein